MKNTFPSVISIQSKRLVGLLAAGLGIAVMGLVVAQPAVAASIDDAEAQRIATDVLNKDAKIVIDTIKHEEIKEAAQRDPRAYLYYHGKEQGLSLPEIQRLDRIMYCESKYNPYARNPHSTAKGLFQFLDSTWRSVGSGDVFSVVDNVEAGVRYYKMAGTRPWVCKG